MNIYSGVKSFTSTLESPSTCEFLDFDSFFFKAIAFKMECCGDGSQDELAHFQALLDSGEFVYDGYV